MSVQSPPSELPNRLGLRLGLRTERRTPNAQRPAPNAQCRAFTLIELLVVIAIIAILGAVTLPMIPGVNDQARIGTCESRLQQIGVALRLYAEDYNRYPESLETLHDGRYLEQRSLLRCDRVEAAYYYRPVSMNAGGGQVVAACCDPATATGRRPHRHRTVFVRLHADGAVSLAR